MVNAWVFLSTTVSPIISPIIDLKNPVLKFGLKKLLQIQQYVLLIISCSHGLTFISDNFIQTVVTVGNRSFAPTFTLTFWRRKNEFLTCQGCTADFGQGVDCSWGQRDPSIEEIGSKTHTTLDLPQGGFLVSPG